MSDPIFLTVATKWSPNYQIGLTTHRNDVAWELGQYVRSAGRAKMKEILS